MHCELAIHFQLCSGLPLSWTLRLSYHPPGSMQELLRWLLFLPFVCPRPRKPTTRVDPANLAKAVKNAILHVLHPQLPRMPRASTFYADSDIHISVLIIAVVPGDVRSRSCHASFELPFKLPPDIHLFVRASSTTGPGGGVSRDEHVLRRARAPRSVLLAIFSLLPHHSVCFLYAH